MKNSKDPIGNRTRDLPACSTMPQPTAPPAACPLHYTEMNILSYYVCYENYCSKSHVQSIESCFYKMHIHTRIWNYTTVTHVFDITVWSIHNGLLLFIPTYQLVMKQHIGSQSLSDADFRTLIGCQHYLTHLYLLLDGKKLLLAVFTSWLRSYVAFYQTNFVMWGLFGRASSSWNNVKCQLNATR